MKKRKRQPRTPEVCPVCDEDVPPNAKSCPQCGACHESGWKDDDLSPEEIDWDIVDLPDEVLDEDEVRAKRSRQTKRAIPSKWRLVALTLVVMWILWFCWFNGWFRLW
jgi:hypothetical protein